MTCYRKDCKSECNELKKYYCIYRLTEEQKDLVTEIKNHHYCYYCGEMLTKAKLSDIKVNLCTGCGQILHKDVVIKRCLVNSRRVG